MPKAVKKSNSKKAGRSRRSRAEVQAILDKIASLRGQGLSIAAALRQVGVPYTNYNYWMKRQSARPAGAARKSGRAPTAKAVEMQATLNDIRKMRAGGQSLEKAIRAKGLTVSNYYYWVKRLHKGTAAAKGARTAAPGHPAGAVGLLNQMQRNREVRERLNQQAQQLDDEFKLMLRKLEAV